MQTPQSKDNQVSDLVKETTRLEKFDKYLETRNFYRNELYNELELYMQDIRQRTNTHKDRIYNPTQETYIDENPHKASEAMDLMRWLKKFVETDLNKLGCI